MQKTNMPIAMSFQQAKNLEFFDIILLIFYLGASHINMEHSYLLTYAILYTSKGYNRISLQIIHTNTWESMECACV
jgi:hypothetical protein